MHRTDTTHRHSHHSFMPDRSANERRTHIVIGITAVMMIVEIIAGISFNSMALLADGIHMGTHVAALFITALAYYLSRRHARDPRYSFGTGKMEVLGGFTSAIILVVVALLLVWESGHRLLAPQPIRFNEAIAVAVIGLIVNIVCALVLRGDHHDHDDHHHHDLNHRAAYLHVLADALTSITAIVALLAGKFYGWLWLDPVMGIIGSVIIAFWAHTLIRNTSIILLDRTPETSDLPEEIRRAVENDGDSLVTDLHVWQLASGRFAAIVRIVAHEPRPLEDYHRLMQEHEELVHITVEVQTCRES